VHRDDRSMLQHWVDRGGRQSGAEFLTTLEEKRPAAPSSTAPVKSLPERLGRSAGLEVRSLILRMRRMPRSGAILVALIALAPLWTLSHARGFGPVSLGSLGVLTLGRALLIVLAVVVGIELVRRRGLVMSGLGLLFIALLIATEAWVYVNGSQWGCLSCEGTFGGLTDMVVASLLALVVLTMHPNLRGPVMLAIALACLLGAALAILHLSGFVSGEPPVVRGRLTGTYGNPNFLAFAISPGVAVLLGLTATRPDWIRVGAVIASAFLALVLILTYSRGGLIAVAISAGVVIVLQLPARRRLAGAAALVALLGAAGAVVAPAINSSRIEDSDPVPKHSVLLRSVDHSGWDGTAQGVVPEGPAAMTNVPPKRVLRVKPSRPGAGVSYPWGVADRGTRYTLRLQLRGPKPGLLRIGLEDNLIAAGPVKSGGISVGRAWRRVALTWTPTLRSPDARLYVWRPVGEQPFELRGVTISRLDAAGRPRVRSISTVLLGSDYPREQERLQELTGADERYFIPSRKKGISLAWKAFRSHPVHGLGWQQFPAYAQRHARFGALPTHNEYLRFAAELGLPGLLLLLALGGCAIAGLGSVPAGPTRLALIGALIAGAVSLLFVNGLVTPAAGVWLCIAAAAAVAARPGSDRRQGSP
jgi:O-antigen ligase